MEPGNTFGDTTPCNPNSDPLAGMEGRRRHHITYGLNRMEQLLDGLGLSALGLYLTFTFDSNKQPLKRIYELNGQVWTTGAFSSPVNSRTIRSEMLGGIIVESRYGTPTGYPSQNWYADLTVWRFGRYSESEFVPKPRSHERQSEILSIPKG
jgi:hypothetical protein